MSDTEPWYHVWRWNSEPPEITREEVTDQRIEIVRTTYGDDEHSVLVDTPNLMVLDTGGQFHIFIHKSLTGGK